jgi:uncharacterized repeat protein (TIGR01451 family)/CSLREA domain-containing protein
LCPDVAAGYESSKGHLFSMTRKTQNSYSRKTASCRMKRCFTPLLLCSVLSGTLAHAAIFSVNSNLDVVDDVPGDGSCTTAGGACTLRAAIQEANALGGADTINVPPGTYTLTISGTGEDAAATGDLDIIGALTLSGSGATTTIIDGGGVDRVFEIFDPSVTLSRVMVQNGSIAADGGGIRVRGAIPFTLSEATVRGNDAAGARGGGVFATSGTLNFTNVTVSGNSAARGGGITVQSGSAFMTNVTVTANTASTSLGGGVLFGGASTVVNTIIANNIGTDCDSAIGPGTNNLDGDGSCGFALTANPLLGPLQDNGGPTWTHAPAPTSPAVEGGSNAGCPATDQRGVARPSGLLCDIGAVEIEADRDISGTVYHDVNDNGSLDAGELGAGVIWVKLIWGGAVIQTVQADTDTGAYNLTDLPDETYTVIVDDNSNATDTTPTEPVNWSFRNPATGSLGVTISGGDETDRDFGLTYDFDLAADCVCGYQDGLFTQRVIGIDGDMADWGPVLSDPDNNACDATDNTDRDHPVQSTGRNLSRTAVTWDATYFSMWTERVGSSNNTQNFIYYADTDVDGKLQTGEPVVVAKWQGNTGNVDLELYSYNEVASGGDPLLDGAGYVDGYSMPGDLTLVKTLNLPDGDGQGATSGAADGTQMEWKVEWSEVGVAAGAAIGWRVSSTNANPGASGLGAQIDDNLGGCGGQCAGSNQIAGVAADPLSGGGGQTVYAPHVFTNTGNGPDLFDFEWSSTGAWVPASVTFYRDLGTVGAFDPGVDVLITDTDGDALPDTGNLVAGESFDLLVAIVLPGPPAVGSATVTITGASNFLPGCGATVTPPKGTANKALYIPGVDLDTTKDDGATEARVGLSVSYTITLSNAGPDDAVDATVNDTFDPAVFDVPNVSWSCAITTAGSGTDACDDPGPTNGDVSTTVDLSNGAEATFTVDAPILLSASGTIDNTFTAAAINETDTDNTNNAGQDNDTVLLVPLEIVKRAFQLDGTPIPNGIDMPNGVPFRFLLYVNNDGPAVTDASLRDVLDPGFAYVPGSARFGTVVACAAAICTPAEEDAIFAAADGGTAGTDAVDTDVVGFAGTTIDAGDQDVGNAQLDIPADTVWALVFTAKLQ